MHGNNPTRDSIERALDFAVTEGLIRSWQRTRPPDRRKWVVEVNPSVHSADGLGTYPISTYQEGRLFCAALASARSGIRQRHLDMVIETARPAQRRIDGLQTVRRGNHGQPPSGF